MNSLPKNPEKYLHFIFIGSLFLIYLGLYIYYRDALFITSGAILDWNYTHFNDVRLNYAFWNLDVGGTSGVDNYYLVSLSYWLPILISKITGLSTLSLTRIQVLILPPLTIFLFYKITSLYYERIGDRILPCVLLALGSWNIFRVTLTGTAAFSTFNGYFSKDFFIFFLAALYFFLKKKINYSGVCIALSIMTHVSMGIITGGFFLFTLCFIFKSSRLYSLITLSAFIGAGTAIQLALLNMVFPSDLPRVSTEVFWSCLVRDGHMNFFMTNPSVFLMFTMAISFLAVSAYKTSEHKVIKQITLLGGAWLALMFLVYLFGWWGKIPDIMRLQPLRFSQSFIFMIFLGVQFPKSRIKGVAFTFFIAGLFGIHSLITPWPAQELIIPKIPSALMIALTTVAALYILFTPRFYALFKKFHIISLRYFFIIFMMGITLASPLLLWPRAVDEKVLKIEEAINFASNNLKGNKTFILWGHYNLMPSELIRAFTQSPTISPHIQGMFRYNKLQLVYEDDIKKTDILFDTPLKIFSERLNNTRKVMKGPFLEKYSAFYKSEYAVTHIIIFNYPEKKIDSVGELLFDNNLIQIYTL
jgi:hypothetical protein